jgi:hypothetical protein
MFELEDDFFGHMFKEMVCHDGYRDSECFEEYQRAMAIHYKAQNVMLRLMVKKFSGIHEELYIINKAEEDEETEVEEPDGIDLGSGEVAG